MFTWQAVELQLPQSDFSFSFFFFVSNSSDPSCICVDTKNSTRAEEKEGARGAYVDFEMHWEWMPAKKENRNMKDIIANILGHLTYCGKAALSLA